MLGIGNSGAQHLDDWITGSVGHELGRIMLLGKTAPGFDQDATTLKGTWM